MTGVLLGGAAVLNLPLPGTATEAALLPDIPCERVTLTRRPGWTIAGAWEGDTLLLADPLYNQVLRFSSKGRALPPLPDFGFGRFLPSIVKPYGESDLILELASGRMIVLGKGGVPKVRRDLLAEASSSKGTVKSMFLWHPVGAEMMTFSDVKLQQEGAWKSDFLRFPIDAPDDFEFMDSTPDDAEALFYTLGAPFISSLGETAYVLRMEQRPTLYKNERGETRLEPLTALPPKLETRPELPPWGPEPGAYRLLMKQIEQSTMPTGLYGWEDDLYVVWRSPEGSGVRWSISKINPRTDTVVGTTTIPTTANHLTVVPGSNRWAFVEKGEVEALGHQKVDKIFFVSAERIRRLVEGNLCG